MNDSEFIELLNLYLDHEISAADAARLEAEVQRDPDRRKIYQQYCRMQKACKVLAADFVADEARSVDAGKKVVAFDPAAASVAMARRKRVHGVYAFGSFAAAAACVALVFVSRGERVTEGSVQAVAQPAAPVPVAVAVATPEAAQPTPSLVNRGGIVSVAAARSQAPVSQPTLVSDPLFLSSPPANVLVTAAMQEANNRLVWIQNLQLTPLQQRLPAESLRFDVLPAKLQPEARTLGGPRTETDAEVELAAFRFRK